MKKKIKKYSYGGFDIDEEIDSLPVSPNLIGKPLTVNNPSFSPERVQFPVNPINPINPVKPIATETAKGSSFDMAKTLQGLGEGLQAFNGIKSKIAKGISTGVDIANTALGAIDSARLKRQEQQQIADSLLKRSSQNDQRQINNIPIYTKFGGSGKYAFGGSGVPKSEGDVEQNPNVEAEDGEIMEHQDGTFFEADGDRHEQGGEKFANISRVLEDTSGKRKDPLSKALLISKDNAEELIGKPVTKGLSHSMAFKKASEQMAKKQGNYLKKFELVDKLKSPNLFTKNSAALNSHFANKVPTSSDLFDTLFDHQEKTKQDFNEFQQKQEIPEMAYGGETSPIGPIIPYKGNHNRKRTPTGKNNAFPQTKEFKAYHENWAAEIPELKEETNADTFQGMIYDYKMKTSEGRANLAQMWKTYGNTEKGKKNKLTQGLDYSNLDERGLALSRYNYADDWLGARTLKMNPNINPKAIEEKPGTITNNYKRDFELDPNKVQPLNIEETKKTPPLVLEESVKSKFNMPLNWSDTIGPLTGLMKAMKRDPELYNPVDIHKVKLALQDVRPVLNNNQAEYNAAKTNVANSSVGNAQAAQLFTNKLSADNQAIGQYENQNKQTLNQEELYNTGAKDKQSIADAQSRQVYYDNVLKGRANQDEAQLRAIESLADNVNKNRAFNKNGNLLMKVAPYFDQKAEWNGRKYNFEANGETVTGVEQKVPAGMTKYKVTTADGKEKIEYLTDREYQIRERNRNIRLQKI